MPISGDVSKIVDEDMSLGLLSWLCKLSGVSSLALCWIEKTFSHYIGSKGHNKISLYELIERKIDFNVTGSCHYVNYQT